MSAGSGNIVPANGNMVLFTYHLSSVSNLHLILGNLLLFDVGPWPRAPIFGLVLGFQVLVNITELLAVEYKYTGNQNTGV